MTDEEGLLKVIVADPDDDTVRLAYADWLDENRCAGHAEFIRVQVELARLDGELAASDEGKTAADGFRKLERREELRRRETALLRGAPLFRFDWYFGPKDAEGVTSATAVDVAEASIRWFNTGPDAVHGVFRRGFVEEVKAPIARFPELVTDLLKKGFPIRRAAATDLDPEWDGTAPGWVRYRTSLQHDNRGDVLPARLYDRLKGGVHPPNRAGAGGWRNYGSVAKAREALSAAIMELGREAAGLT
jgi:uncharacterized protein (TIGR02996 family)